MDLGKAPGLGEVAERDLACLGCDVLTGDDGRAHVVEPPLGVRLPREVSCMLPVLCVAVAGTPPPVRAPGDVSPWLYGAKAYWSATRAVTSSARYGTRRGPIMKLLGPMPM